MSLINKLGKGLEWPKSYHISFPNKITKRIFSLIFQVKLLFMYKLHKFYDT